ncbi:jg3116 [Pararge aegeria aegeria]|uniref:Jg3116 protein n=1 Tax=Pararge aegeria aegeria TaxID=348720 RepID=A0A8S4RDE8_9NEOP|nr:jg3116 [Pararge aegeria aegeria]
MEVSILQINRCKQILFFCRVVTADENTVVTIPLRTRRLREYNGERAAASSVLLLPSTAITDPHAQRGDYGQILQLGEASNPAVTCNRLVMMMKQIVCLLIP